MGRYYSGDIEGKFWFAVQSSSAASRFGGECHTSEVIKYYFDKDTDYEDVCKEIEKIKNNLGSLKVKLDDFFNEHNNGYNDEMLVDYGIPQERLKELLIEYADLELGIKIKECLEKQDYCTFEAEYLYPIGNR